MAISFGLALTNNEHSFKKHNVKHIKTDGLETESNGIPPKRLLQELSTSNRINIASQLELQVFSLTNIIAHLSVPQEKMHWLDVQKSSPKKSEVAVEEYMRALCLLFTIVVTSPSLKHYDLAMQKLVIVHLKENILEFLARIWTDNDVVSTPVVKARALQLASMYIDSHSNDKVDYQTIIPSLLILVGHESTVVRKEAVECLGKLYKVYDNMGAIGDDKFYNNTTSTGDKKKVAATMYGSSMSSITKLSHSDASHFVDHLWHKKRELSEDANYVPVVLKEYFDACIAANKKNKMSRVLDYFLSCIDHYPTIYGQVALLKQLNFVQSPRKMNNLLGLLERSLRSLLN
jgi:hypothetical protein